MKQKVDCLPRKGKVSGAGSKVRKGLPKLPPMPLADRVIELIESARQKVAVAANIAQVYTNFEIGRQIVMEEQGGKARAEYGREIVDNLSERLTLRFGRGWSAQSLWRMRQFFLMYSDSLNIVETIDGSGKVCNRVDKNRRKKDSLNTVERIDIRPQFVLGWSHYLLLMTIADPVERAFYEREAAQGGWSFRQLERMYRSSIFERLEISKDKNKVRSLMNRPAPDIEVAGEALKDPIVTEFLGTPDGYSESELEDRICNHIQDFMLEMGKGFTFHGRQVRCVIGHKSYYVDLAFYNRYTRSFFVIDLKLTKVGHAELGQMQTYVNYFDRKIRLPEENPTIGILLTSEKIDHALVEMFLPESEQNRIFVKQYTHVLPSKKALQNIVIEEKRKYNKEQILALAAKKSSNIKPQIGGPTS